MGSGVPAIWSLARGSMPSVAQFLRLAAPGVAEAIDKALRDGTKEIEDIYLTGEEAELVWQAYEKGREVLSADVE
jgi:hypothetical protein